MWEEKEGRPDTKAFIVLCRKSGFHTFLDVYVCVHWVFCPIISSIFPLAAVHQGHPTDRFGKLSVRKSLNPLQLSKGNFHHELS